YSAPYRHNEWRFLYRLLFDNPPQLQVTMLLTVAEGYQTKGDIKKEIHYADKALNMFDKAIQRLIGIMNGVFYIAFCLLTLRNCK
ncbi:hypothetical protein PSY44_23755, partial [Shigella flexneri]|nr:hypothetical protein [Shigella flexneri]